MPEHNRKQNKGKSRSNKLQHFLAARVAYTYLPVDMVCFPVCGL